MTAEPVVFGAGYSVYVRIVRLTLEEKGVAYRLEPVDIFAESGPPEGYRTRHPFGKIPAFEHGDFCLFETSAITRYVDEAFVGPALQPENPRDRARMSQAIGLLDSYGYRAIVWDIYVERVSRPRDGKVSDEAQIAEALPVAETCLDVLEKLAPDAEWLAGEAITLADLHAAPMFAYFIRAPEGAAMLARYPRMTKWWRTMSARRSFLATAE